MTKLSKFTVLAIFCLLTASAFAQFSRNDAIDLVLNTILADDIGGVDVYASSNSFTTDIELIDNVSPTNPYSEAHGYSFRMTILLLRGTIIAGLSM